MRSARSKRSPIGVRPRTGPTGAMQRGEIWFAATPGGDRPVLVLALAVVGSLIAFGSPAWAAEGGTSIANAPTVAFGEPEDGIGAHDIPNGGSSGTDYGHAFWRVRAFAGDVITGTGSEANSGGC